MSETEEGEDRPHEWCNACRSYHVVPRTKEEHRALLCFAPPPGESAYPPSKRPPELVTPERKINLGSDGTFRLLNEREAIVSFANGGFIHLSSITPLIVVCAAE